MDNVSNLTVKDYISFVDKWYSESRDLPINRWSIFQRAWRWRW